MDLSGLIFVALALVWGVVLIPKALRAHDHDERTRSVQTTSADARVLARGGRAVVPATEQSTAQTVVPTGAESLRREGAAAAVTRQRKAAASAARRRRRVLGLLLLVTGAVGGASATGVLVPWAAAVPGGLVIVFLVLARVLVRREHAAWERVLERLHRESGSADADEPEPPALPAPHPAREPDLHVVARNDQGLAVVSDVEDTSFLDAEALAAAVAGPGGGTLWDPLPVTLPTYVTKPRASRSVRTIDLGSPGVSSSGHDAGDTALVAGAAGADEQEPPAQRAVGS